MMVDNNQPEGLRTQLPPLREIEEAGDAAAFEIARRFLNESQATGEAIDGGQLERVGPEVVRAYVRLLAKAVHEVAAASPTAPSIESVDGKQNSTRYNRDADRLKPYLQPANNQMPRAQLNWHSQRCSSPDFDSQSRHISAAIGLVVYLVAYLSYASINTWLIAYYQ